MGIAPTSASEAMDMVQAGLCYLAAADAASLTAEAQAECLRGLERADAISTAARASFLSVFTVGKGHTADADYSARAWLMHKTGITRGAAASHTAWARPGRHPSPGCRGAGHRGPVRVLWPGDLPVDRHAAREVPGRVRRAADRRGARRAWRCADLAALFAEMYERARGRPPR